MASEHPDAWLWVCMVALGYYAAWGVRRQLALVRKAVEIKEPEKDPGMVDQATEDAIKLKTLGQLVESPNFDIREASIRIVRERVLKQGLAWDLLIKHLASSKPSRRNKALTSLSFLTTTPTPDFPIVQAPFFNALVTCLCDFLPEASAAVEQDTYPSEYQVHALHLLDIIFDDDLPSKALEHNIKTALDAGLVSKWLVNYPFCAQPSKNRTATQEKCNTIRQLLRADPNNNCHPKEMSYILRMLVSDTTASEELYRYGLWEQHSEQEDSESGQRRRIEESPEEVQLRRRRREAMVLGEEGREVRRSDIFERADEIRDEDVEEEIEDLLGEVLEAEHRGERGLRGLWNVVRRFRPDGLVPL